MLLFSYFFGRKKPKPEPRATATDTFGRNVPTGEYALAAGIKLHVRETSAWIEIPFEDQTGPYASIGVPLRHCVVSHFWDGNQ